AENVSHRDTAGETPPVWNIAVAAYEAADGSEYTYNFSGVIGAILENADVCLNIVNNAVSESGHADIESSGSAGLAAGSMGNNSSLTVSLSGDNKAFSVTSSGGSTGGLVGTMGEGASLTLSGDFTASGSITGSASAGGLVGTMAKGASLTLNGAVNITGSISAGNYAGGLVGYAEDINALTFGENAVSGAVVSGVNGSGGVFGGYLNTSSITFDGVTVTNAALNGGYAGGFIGRLMNNGEGSTVTVTGGSFTSQRTAADRDNKYLGGIIGYYTAASTKNALIINGKTKVEISKSDGVNASYYGGVIAVVEGASYVSLDKVTVTVTGYTNTTSSGLSNYFGGIIGLNSGGFIDAKDITVSAGKDPNSNNNMKGGGVIGELSGGVLRLSGTTDLSGTRARNENNSGQIVGKRGQALVYAADGWTFVRGEAVLSDDIGTWGEVLRFGEKTGGALNEADVLTLGEGEHTVTVKPVSANPTIGDLKDFAILALNIQLNTGSDSGTLLFDSGSAKSAVLLASTITLNTDIDLAGTGITGLTRDDGANNAFTGTFEGNNHTIYLATGEVYGDRGSLGTPATTNENGSGYIHRHIFTALFSKTGNATFNKVNIAGSIDVDVQGPGSSTYIAGLSGLHTEGSLTVTECSVSTIMNVRGSNNSYTFVGGIMGRVNETKSANEITITVSDCALSPEITKLDFSNKYYNGSHFMIGGAIGELSTNKVFTVTFTGTTVGAKITDQSNSNRNKTGGLIGNISNYSGDADTADRKVIINSLTFDGTEVTSASSKQSSVTDPESNCGGLLGEVWNNVHVVIGGAKEDEKGITVRNSTVSCFDVNTTADYSHMAGLCTAATGHWQVYDISIESITVIGSMPISFGMFINKGVFKDNSRTYALYLELMKEKAFRISSADLSGLNSAATFDELLVCASENYSSKAPVGNCAVVSVKTSGNTLVMDGSNCNTYQNQTDRAIDNPYSRYYYNLDTIRAKETLTDGEKLLLWSLNKYAYGNVKAYFANHFDNENTIPEGNYDMTGLSYYPIDVSSITVSSGASFTFCNSEFESGESKSGNTDSKTRSTGAENSQHYLMHFGLFRNVSSSLTVNGAEFSGTVGAAAESGGSGALVCGTVSGAASDSLAQLSINNIVLNGVSVTDTSGYAPLLINKIGSNSKTEINSVSTTANYTGAAASSLIGDVGGDTADNISLTFSGLILDGRLTTAAFNTEGTAAALTSAYGTSSSIFSRATLLNSFRYPDGASCSAVYNFGYSEDWNADDTCLHHVTYGKEISDTLEYRESGLSMQRKYIDSTHYTNPEEPNSNNAGYNFGTRFLPYVYTESNITASVSIHNHEIKVNYKDDTG
ncbi:MAG: beta strand repeat-containing protein, partial [Ruminiclostridium sp.]